MRRFLVYAGMVLFLFMDKFPPSLAEKAEAYHVIWDSNRRLPIAVIGSTFYLEPCDVDNPDHIALFERIYTDPDTMRYFGTGEVRSKADAANALKRYAQPWQQHQLTGGFVVRHQGKAVMLVGVGLFQAAGVGEFYIMADPTVRGKGLATLVMATVIEWCRFLNASRLSVCVNYSNGKKAPMDTIFATASEENIPSIRLMLKSGFKPIQSLHRYRMGFPKNAQMFPAPSGIKGLKDGHLSMIYPTRYMKRKAGFELKLKEFNDK
jgi:RimJ/RimL family protein N-acetyltransferase